MARKEDHHIWIDPNGEEWTLWDGHDGILLSADSKRKVLRKLCKELKKRDD